MKSTIAFALKWAAMFAGLFIAQMALGMLLPRAAAMPKPDGPIDIMQAMALVTLIQSLMMTVLAQNLKGGLVRKAIALFAVFFVVDCGLSLIEAIYFNTYLKLSSGLLVNMGITGLIKAAVAALIGAFLWNEPPAEGTETLKGLMWKVPLLSLLYVVFYYGAGAFIAFQSETVRAFYNQGMQINNGELALLQVFRGAIWVGIAYMLATGLKGSTLKRAVITGLSFSLIMATPLLYPNDAMPWAVRYMHLIEIGVSNVLYGMLCIFVLRAGTKSDAG